MAACHWLMRIRVGRCKKQVPPASKIKANKVKEVQYDRHDELGDKIKGIKMLWDKVGCTPPVR